MQGLGPSTLHITSPTGDISAPTGFTCLVPKPLSGMSYFRHNLNAFLWNHFKHTEPGSPEQARGWGTHLKGRAEAQGTCQLNYLGAMCMGFSTIIAAGAAPSGQITQCWAQTDKERERCLCGRTESLSRGKIQELKDRNTILYLSNRRAQTPLQVLTSSTADYSTTNSFCSFPSILNNFCQIWYL